jgi:hypothetical protein
MNKTTTVLKITAIILNTLFLTVLALLYIQSPAGGPSIIIAVMIFLFPLTNLLALLFSSKFLIGTKGAVLTALSVILSIMILLILTLVIGQSGTPEPIMMRAFLVIWILSPVLNIPAVILLRARVQKNTPAAAIITCPHCGGDVTIDG